MKVTAEDIKKIKEERKAKAAKASKKMASSVSAAAAVDVDEAETPAVSLVETSEILYKRAEEKKEKASLLLDEHTACRLAGDRAKAEALLREAELLLEETDDLISRANTLKEKEEAAKAEAEAKAKAERKAAAEAKAEAEAKTEREKITAEVKGKKPNFVLNRGGDDAPIDMADFVFSNGKILKKANGKIVLELEIIDIR